jgi:hypothetical protein
MIRLGIPYRTLSLWGYWDYDPLINNRLRPLHDRELHLFLLSEEDRVRYIVKSFSDCIQHSLV